MDEQNILILINEENKIVDKTAEIKQITKTVNGKIDIIYKTKDKKYTYLSKNVVIRDKTSEIDVTKKDIYYKSQIIFNVKKAMVFREYIKVIYNNDITQVFNYYEILVKPNTTEEQSKTVMTYFKEISNYATSDKENEKEYKDGFLKNQYKKINYIKEESVLNYYINKKNLIKPNIENKHIIYPFKFNLSQKIAIENALKSNISVIQGPPGTGKTQTILNIIVNLAIIQNKKIAVVSNNNEAVKNVKDKMEDAGYDFIIANLGNKSKRENFFQMLPQPKIDKFEQSEEFENIQIKLEELNNKLEELLKKNNEKAILEKKIEEYKLEQRYFEEYYKNQNIEEIGKLSFYNETDDRILEFLLDSQILYEHKVRFKWLYKIKMLMKYKIIDLKQLDTNLADNILILQRKYYDVKIKKLEEEHNNIKEYLETHKFKKLQEEHQKISEKILKSELYKRYSGKENKFTFKDYKWNIEEFTQAFPVILSTTYSLRDSLPYNYMLDYIIIDEVSQVDLLAGSLALSCAKNAIIVGDEKQLPQIVDKKIKEKIPDIKVDICYDYFKNNMLSAILRAYGKNIPQKTLIEHYRCHPKIIEFCNKRYYNGKLVAFATPDHLKVNKPLVIYKTQKGNHMRKVTKGENTGIFNERELEVIRDEVLEKLEIQEYDSDEIGITTPYRMQANNIQSSVGNKIKTDTIHKFQGREKKLMILSTVLDDSYQGKRGIDFVDDPCMVNVAVSRAIEKFVIVTGDVFEKEGNDIKALLKYIKYNELSSEIVNSQIVSVFDLLYSEYSEKLKKLNESLLNRSYFKSENIIDTILYNEFKKDDYTDYKYEREILLRNVFRNLENLNYQEKRYINNGARFDFVIYDKMNNNPKLFIEVDGFAYHRNNPTQLEKDKLKDSISYKNGINIIRFETGGKAYSEDKIVSAIREKILKDN